MKLQKLLKIRYAEYILLFSVCIAVCLIVYFSVSAVLSKIVEKSLKEMAVQGAQMFQMEVDRRLEILQIIAEDDIIEDPAILTEDKLKKISSQYKTDTFLRLSIANINGYSLTTDGHSLYVGDREYFKSALSGISNISDPLVSRIDGDMVYAFAVPIYHNDKVNGVLYATYSIEVICKITDDLKVSEDGYSYIINKNGRLIAHKDRNLILHADEMYESIKSDPQSKSVVTAINDVMTGKIAAVQYTYQGAPKYMAFASTLR